MATGITDSHGAEFLAQPRAEWFGRAACKGQDVDLFFVERGLPIWDALAFCSRCPVRRECLQYALDNNITIGVWGGKSVRARRDPVRRATDVPVPTRNEIVRLWELGYRQINIARELGISEAHVSSCLGRYRRAKT